MSDISSADPKVFISYSWSSPDHEAWVVSFAEELTSQGLNVILDKWDLKPGHDANAFMESMVTDADVNKVVLICDRKYTEKSDTRSGGAGTEAQIITPGLYAKRAQDKFVAVVRERNEEDKPYLPVYYGSRIYIDLSNPSTYSTEFERLVRWAYDKPIHVRPTRGSKPSFLADSAVPAKIASSVTFRRASDAIKNNQANAAAAVGEYFTTIVTGLEQFRIAVNQESRETFDDLMVASVNEFLPYRNELIEIFSAIAQYAFTDEMVHVVHRFFERLIPYLSRPEHINSWNESDFDNFHFIIHELFLYAIGIFVKYERFDAASVLVEQEYFWQMPNGDKENMHSFHLFREHLRSLEHRNRRLKLNRLSVRADMLNERSKTTGIDFKYIMTADFVLYLRSHGGEIWGMWWPETLLYVGRYGGAFEMFARSKSVQYFEKVKKILGVANKQGLRAILDKLKADPDRIPKWQFDRIDPERLVAYEAIGTTP